MTRYRTATARIGLLLIALLIGLLFTTSCASLYSRAKARYGTTTIADTTYTRITLTVPRDSVILKVRTDTTHLIERTRQGRATVTIIREPTYTTIRADCDSARRDTVVATRIITERWGVDPAYQERATKWKTAFWVAIGLLLMAALVYVFAHKFRLSVSKR
jgi:hypothetical protein